MEVVPDVTRKWSDLAGVLKICETDCASLSFTENSAVPRRSEQTCDQLACPSLLRRLLPLDAIDAEQNIGSADQTEQKKTGNHDRRKNTDDD
jgi:hypothetical protein